MGAAQGALFILSDVADEEELEVTENKEHTAYEARKGQRKSREHTKEL